MADAYGTDVEFNAWLASYGLTLPADGPSEAVLRAIGSSYVDAAYEHKLQCSQRTDGHNQTLAWPRTGHPGIDDATIPQAWINAAYRAAYLEATNPGWATSTRDVTRITKREKVDVVEREFFGPDGPGAGSNVAPGMASDGMIEGLVAGLLCATGRRTDWFMVI